MMEEQVFGKMLSLRLDVSNGGSGAGSRGIKTRRDDRARRRGSRAGGARDKTNRNGETRVRFDLGSADAVAGWTRFRDFADASGPWSLEMYGRANAETLREAGVPPGATLALFATAQRDPDDLTGLEMPMGPVAWESDAGGGEGRDGAVGGASARERGFAGTALAGSQ